jgi:hypothetical protein
VGLAASYLGDFEVITRYEGSGHDSMVAPRAVA